MKNLITELSLVLSFILSLSCTNTTENKSTIKVDINQRDDISLAKMFTKIELIPLETTEESIIKSIGGVKYSNKQFYILDFSTSSIFIFDDNGNYLSKIDNHGNGPYEYKNISDFIINKNQIELLDPINQSISKYTTNGVFVEKLKLPTLSQGTYKSMSILNEDTIVFWTYDYDNRIKYYSRQKQKIVFEAFPEGKKDIFCPYEFAAPSYLCRSLNNKVYKLGEKGLTTAYEWDFGKYNNNEKNIKFPKNPREIPKYVKACQNSEIVNYILSGQVKNNNYYYSRITRENKILHLFYNTQEDKTMLFEKSTEGLSIYPILMDENIIIGSHFEGKLDEVVNTSILSETEKSKLTNHKDDDNQMLIKYYF